MVGRKEAIHSSEWDLEKEEPQFVAEIKKVLAISGMLCGTYSWRSRSEDPDVKGAQIDLVIDRAVAIV